MYITPKRSNMTAIEKRNPIGKSYFFLYLERVKYNSSFAIFNNQEIKPQRKYTANLLSLKDTISQLLLKNYS